jgi:hypothetical protein
MGLRCPKCGSSRVRRGYERPALPLRLIGIQSLLCDGCNLAHRGFALPGTVPTHSAKRKRYYRREHPSELEEVAESQYAGAQEESVRPLEAVSFGWYYVKLRFKVLLGLHTTTHSLGLKYRWRHWQHLQRDKLR